jgi:cytochrome c5
LAGFFLLAILTAQLQSLLLFHLTGIFSMAEKHSSKGIMWTTIIVTIALIAIIYPLTDRSYRSAADLSNGNDAADIRIQPVAKFAMPAEAAPTTSGAPKDGPTVFNSVCGACHNTGAAGSPKAGDKAAWAPRLALGKEALYKSAINGKNAMPPKGGAAALSDDEIKAAVDHMIGLVK